MLLGQEHWKGCVHSLYWKNSLYWENCLLVCSSSRLSLIAVIDLVRCVPDRSRKGLQTKSVVSRSQWDPTLKAMNTMQNWISSQALGVISKFLHHLPQLKLLDVTIIDAVVDSTYLPDTVFACYLWDLISMTGLSSLRISCAMPDSSLERLSLPTSWTNLPQ